MGKIFGYELRRLLWNKFFVGFVLVLLFYGWQVLNRVTILGVAHTAPFSPWSFGHYLSRMLPLLWIGTLFFLTFFTSRAERRRAVLTSATPVKPSIYGLTRCAAALTGSVLLTLCCVGEAAIFYSLYFSWYSWETLLFPTLVTLVPPLIFALGSGWLLGRLRPWLLYPWMILPFLLIVLPSPDLFGLLSGTVFVDYPLTIGVLDPAFSLPIETVLTQCALFLMGIVFLMIHPIKDKRH